MKETVAYLGPGGTFTHEAARALFSNTAVSLVPYASIPDVLNAVDRGECLRGVVPVENAIEGSVTLTLDWLIHQVDVPITAELIYPISQNLLVHPAHADRPLTEFVRVLSHPQAVAQCRMYLREHLPGVQVTYVDSTAEAAERVGNHPGEKWLAIGTQTAHQLYGLQVLDRDIQDVDHNFTRFIAVGKALKAYPAPPTHNKSSWLITLPSDYPGALYKVLASFARREVNLSRIESRPTKKRLGTYHFFIDAEKGGEDPAMIAAVEEIKTWGCQVRHLGTYHCFSFRQNQLVPTY